MIYPGTDLKFRITSEIQDFSLADDDFLVEVIDQYRRVKYRLTRDDCFQDSEGQWYFTLEHVTSGPYWAKFTAAVPDSDYNKLFRKVVDAQPLCVVGFCEKHQPFMFDCDAGNHKVSYLQVWTVDLDDGTYLADSDGNLITTGDGRRIGFTGGNRQTTLDMTAEEFKQLVEGSNPNGAIDTIPEVLDAMGGIPEDTEYGVMSDDDVDDMMGRVLGDSSSSA